VKLTIHHKYNKGDEPVWWAFSSATATLSVLQNEQFLGTAGDRTIFQLQNVRRAVDIAKYSAIKAEDERLILCGTPFVVKSKMNMGNGLWMVQMEEDLSAPPLVTGFSFGESGGGAGGSGSSHSSGADASAAVSPYSPFAGTIRIPILFERHTAHCADVAQAIVADVAWKTADGAVQHCRRLSPAPPYSLWLLDTAW
jgi:hypothetical protein